MVNLQDCNIVVSEFGLQSHNSGQFLINTLGKVGTLSPHYQLNSTITVFLKDGLEIK